MTPTIPDTSSGSETAPATTAAVNLDPLAVTLETAVLISGLSRSELYRRAALGDVDLRKATSRSTIVVYASLRALVASLPRANVRLRQAPLAHTRQIALTQAKAAPAAKPAKPVTKKQKRSPRGASSSTELALPT